MDFTQAQQALIRHLQAMPQRPPLVYPNVEGSRPLPRIVVQVASYAGQPLTLDGIVDAATEISAQVEVASGRGDEAAGIIQRILSHFPLNLRIDGLVIDRPPMPRPPIQYTGYQATPVIIRGRHFF